jgi:hypothetical protein
MTTLVDLSKMIRPWYRGSDGNARSEGDHIYVDCEWLAEEGEPREGVGWLDPYGTDVCEECRGRYDPAAYAKWASDEYE